MTPNKENTIMHAISNNAPTNVAALDDRDLKAGNASHTYGIQYGGPKDVCHIQFQHGPRGVEGSTPGVFDDDLLAIIKDRLEGFQSGPFACQENAEALEAVRVARDSLGLRVARRIAQGVLGANTAHVIERGEHRKENTDQLGRTLPLEGHHKDCGHGKDGWSLCTCDELKKVDEERSNKLFKDLVEEGQQLRKEFDQKTAGMRGPPQCSKCGDTGLVAYGPNIRGMKHCDCGRLSNGHPTIRTPDGKPLLPAAEFSAMRIKDNKERGITECNFQRQTGRTTAMVIQALEFVKQNSMGGVVIEVDSQRMRKRVKELLLHYADEMGVGHREHARIFTKTPSENIPGIDIGLQLRDNVIDDVKNITLDRDPRQDLKPGELVRFEMDGVITERQTGGIVKDFDGNDFEPIQYEITHPISGNKSYIPYNRIIKVIGKEK